MFIGHFGIGFVAKKAAPAVSLGMLFIAAQFIDLLWPVLILMGVEHVLISPGITKITPLDFIDYPISHSLLLVLIWALVMGAVYFLIRKKLKYSIVLALCVISHWVLDLLVHRPDLPLYPGSSLKTGLGLWNHPAIAIIIEMVIFLTGILIYSVLTRAKNKTGSIVLWILVGLLLVVHIMNLLGPPPPNVIAIAWGGQLQWIFVLLAFWVDKNREIKTNN